MGDKFWERLECLKLEQDLLECSLSKMIREEKEGDYLETKEEVLKKLSRVKIRTKCLRRNHEMKSMKYIKYPFESGVDPVISEAEDINEQDEIYFNLSIDESEQTILVSPAQLQANTEHPPKTDESYDARSCSEDKATKLKKSNYFEDPNNLSAYDLIISPEYAKMNRENGIPTSDSGECFQRSCTSIVESSRPCSPMPRISSNALEKCARCHRESLVLTRLKSLEPEAVTCPSCNRKAYTSYKSQSGQRSRVPIPRSTFGDATRCAKSPVQTFSNIRSPSPVNDNESQDRLSPHFKTPQTSNHFYRPSLADASQISRDLHTNSTVPTPSPKCGEEVSITGNKSPRVSPSPLCSDLPSKKDEAHFDSAMAIFHTPQFSNLDDSHQKLRLSGCLYNKHLYTKASPECPPPPVKRSEKGPQSLLQCSDSQTPLTKVLDPLHKEHCSAGNLKPQLIDGLDLPFGHQMRGRLSRSRDNSEQLKEIDDYESQQSASLVYKRFRKEGGHGEGRGRGHFIKGAALGRSKQGVKKLVFTKS